MSRFVEVHAVRLDDYFRDYSKETSLVKMDVGGNGRRCAGCSTAWIEDRPDRKRRFCDWDQ